jgi:signal transduction histidine kinase
VIVPLDAPKVERMVENLLANAVRHTPRGSRLWARVWPQDGGAVIAIEDDGPGVPDDIRGVIFEPFRKGAPGEDTPGSGIGLSLVARFAELHHGRAWVEDRMGGGASFRIFLPGRQSA